MSHPAPDQVAGDLVYGPVEEALGQH
jgi:hypothetical protein